MKPIGNIGFNGSVRINNHANQFRTSSNKTFQEQSRSGIGLTNSALRQVGAHIPGTPALSATLNDARPWVIRV